VTELLPPELARYSRQILCEQMGVEAQRRLCKSRVVLIGCGALGTVLADTLVRGGVGHVTICDRDFIEKDNLQRQILFDEDDLAANLPKAEAAAKKLRRINSDILIESMVTDVNSANIERLTEGADLLLDGTDNFETRYLINDLAVKSNRPWVYGAVIGATGLCMTIIPQKTPCLKCVFDEAPPQELNPTCETAGVLTSAVHVVAGLQAVEAIKILSGRQDQINPHLTSVDLWTGRFINLKVASAYKEGQCSVCGKGEYAYLSGQRGSSAITLCGRNAVQVNLAGEQVADFSAIAAKLGGVAKSIVHNAYLLKAEIDAYELTYFADGRAIIKGTDDPERARSIYAKYLGS
jgi:adenylyltransferase/sulfurtransferase